MTMTLTLEPVAPPVQQDPHGVYRVSGTRVTLQSILALFQQGATAEDIHQAFPAVPLPDVYATLAFYLKNRPAADAYLESIEKIEDAARKQMKSRFPMTEMRERLLKRRNPVSA